ncbi:MAG: phosphoglycerate kinase [Patescibacteria group bacterium]|jgi:phosphoglycerate kinase
MNTLNNLDLQNKIVLLRVDYNVPVDETGKVADTARITETIPTVNYLREHGAKIVLMAHFGRPKGQVVETMRFTPIVETISQVLGVQVLYTPELISPIVKSAITAMSAGEVMLLENIRFYPGEETNDPVFAKQLASLGEVYVNDAFGAAHRAHASTAGVAQYLPHAAGLLMQREVEELSKVLNTPEHPVIAIIGGAKISTKLALIKNLLPKVDKLLLGGALANTMMLAQGYDVKKSLVEPDLINTVKSLISDKIMLPSDVVWDKQDRILDIGPNTVQAYTQALSGAKTIIWNGPMGMFEQPEFAAGTLGMAKAVVASGAYSVLGGGETVSAVHQAGLADKVSFISTGGGAMLEFLEGKQLPGIICLN